MSALDTIHEREADVRAAFQRLLEQALADAMALREELAAVRADRDRLTALVERQTRRIEQLQTQVAELDGSAREDAEYDERNGDADVLPGRAGFRVLP